MYGNSLSVSYFNAQIGFVPIIKLGEIIIQYDNGSNIQLSNDQCKMVKKEMYGNSLSASYSGAQMGFVLIIKLCQSKIRYLGVEIFIQQHIIGLDVPMNNLQFGLFMKVSQTFSDTNTNPMPCLPIQSQLTFLRFIIFGLYGN